MYLTEVDTLRYPSHTNWVCSNIDPNHKRYISPISYKIKPNCVPFKYLIKIIKQIKGSKILLIEDNYMHVTFTSKIFKIVEDIEFLYDDDFKLIYISAISKKNKYIKSTRKRIEYIREKFLLEL